MRTNQHGNATLQTIAYATALVIAAGFFMPYILDIFRSGKTDQAAQELRQVITKMRSNHIYSSGNYAQTSPEEFAAALASIKEENKAFYADGAGAQTRITHTLGDETKPIGLAPAMIVYSNDAARLTIPGLQRTACKSLPMAVTAIVDTLTINGAPVKALNNTLSRELVDKIAQACRDGDDNTLEVVFR